MFDKKEYMKGYNKEYNAKIKNRSMIIIEDIKRI